VAVGGLEVMVKHKWWVMAMRDSWQWQGEGWLTGANFRERHK